MQYRSPAKSGAWRRPIRAELSYRHRCSLGPATGGLRYPAPVDRYRQFSRRFRRKRERSRAGSAIHNAAPCHSDRRQRRLVADQPPKPHRRQHRHRPVRQHRMECQRPITAVFQTRHHREGRGAGSRPARARIHEGKLWARRRDDYAAMESRPIPADCRHRQPRQARGPAAESSNLFLHPTQSLHHSQGRNTQRQAERAHLRARPCLPKSKKQRSTASAKATSKRPCACSSKPTKFWLEPYGAPSKATTRLKARR